VKSVDALLSGMVDYAGLFPPASEDMRTALEQYDSYRRGPARAALGRFIVPLSRLAELDEAGRDLITRGPGAVPWRLSVLVAEDIRDASDKLIEFNRRHSEDSRDGHAVIDVAEMKASTANEIEGQRRHLPASFIAYFEIPISGDVTPLVRTIAKVRGRAKVRTGGVTPEAFPSAQALLEFMIACRRESVQFKATAGLHHPVRAEYRLTYERNSPAWMMFGFVNVFFAAALLYVGDSDATALSALEETDPAAFRFEEDAIVWRGKRVSAAQIAASRAEFAMSFGSCSFREPTEELARLTRRARSND
jgi:hypothetical protein